MVGWFRSPRAASPKDADLMGWPSDWDDPVPATTTTSARDGWGSTYPAPARTPAPPTRIRSPTYPPPPVPTARGHRYDRYESYESCERYEPEPPRRHHPRNNSRDGSWQSTPSTPAATGTNNVPLGRGSRYSSSVSHSAATSYAPKAFDRHPDHVSTSNTWSSPDDRRAPPRYASDDQYARPRRSDYQSQPPNRCPWSEPTPYPSSSSTSARRRHQTPDNHPRYARESRDTSVQGPRFGDDQRGFHDGPAVDSPSVRSDHRRRENSRHGVSYASASRNETSSHSHRPESITGTKMVPLAYCRYQATSGVGDNASLKPSSATQDESRPDPDTSSHHARTAPVRATTLSPVKVQDKDPSAPQDFVAIEASLQAVLSRRKVRLGSPSTRKLFGSALRSVAYQSNATASPSTAFSQNLKRQQSQDAQDAQVSTTDPGAVTEVAALVFPASASDDDWWGGPHDPPAIPAGATSDLDVVKASSSKKRSREENEDSQKGNAEKEKKIKVDDAGEPVVLSNWAPKNNDDQKTPHSASPSSKDTADTSERTTETRATTIRVGSESKNLDPSMNMTPPMSPRVVACKLGHLLSCPVPRAPPSIEHEAVQQLEIETKQLDSGWF